MITLFERAVAALFSVVSHTRRSPHPNQKTKTTKQKKGLPTIRAYGAGPAFHAAFLAHLTAAGSWWQALLGTARWVGFRLDVIAATVLVAGALLAMALRSRVSPVLLGLALTHALQLTGMLQWVSFFCFLCFSVFGIGGGPN